MVALSAPMMAGIFSAIAFNLADTYFVAMLGTEELAAMSFTFPVVMVLIGVAWGLGTGTISVVSRAVGSGDTTFVKRLCTDSLTLGFLIVVVLAGLGMFTIDPMFRFLGASEDLLPLITDYMEIWYFGMIFLVVPMVANAAIATVIARSGTMVATLLILHYREHLLDLRMPKFSEVWTSWKAIGEVALPATVTNIFVPFGSAVITRLVAEHGPSAVAAWGVGSRLSAFVLIPINGYCSGLVPFVGQNWGAGLLDRVRSARNLGYGFGLVWGILTLALLTLWGDRIAALFTSDEVVRVEITRYLSVIPFGYALVGVFNVTDETLNTIGRPILATTQTFVHTFALAVPLALYGGVLQVSTEYTTVLWQLIGAVGCLDLRRPRGRAEPVSCRLSENWHRLTEDEPSGILHQGLASGGSLLLL
jgi:Na+-driven multidrug efflux pump